MAEVGAASERRARLEQSRLYLCTPDRPDLEEFLEEALGGGVDIVQLREKGIEARRELALLEVVRDVATRHGALWSVNDRADVAVVSGTDVLHVGQGDLPPSTARRIVGPDLLIGSSTHDESQVAAAAVDPDIDYFCVGPTWPTPTKPGRPAPGLALTRFAAQQSNRPWFAIGGIDLDNLDEVLAAGATRAVVVRAITQASDPRAAAAALSQRLAAQAGAAAGS